MSEQALALETVRKKIIDDPEVILEDQMVMRALIDANARSMGSNIVDLRGIAMDRLENRLDRLEDTHRSVIAAAYENLTGTNLVHQAVLNLLEPVTFPEFLEALAGPLQQTMHVNHMQLVLETADPEGGVPGFEHVLTIASQGMVDHYISAGRKVFIRPITLRQISPASPDIYGEKSSYIRSEALLKLDLGEGRLPGLLIMGSEDPHQFRPNQGTDLLAFFCGAFERAMRRWLG